MKRNAWITLILGFILAAILSGAYWLFKRYLDDRNRAMSYQGSPAPTSNSPTRPTRKVTYYNADELAKARREGRELPATAPSTPPPQPMGMDETVQRNLRTLDEINRVNQMNQRLMEQNERMRKQQQKN